MKRQSFWSGFVVPWIGFALFWAEFAPGWGFEASWLRRLSIGLVAGFLFASFTYVVKRRILDALLRWMAQRKQVPPAA
jgi:hypothetical protein